MEGETQPLPACVSKVLDDDDLLAEIIVRVGFPASLVRAAVVCRRWLRITSDRAFLRRFRKLHPPRLLGFYHLQSLHGSAAARLFPMLPPPELAAVIRRASFKLDLDDGALTDMVVCWNGRVLTSRLRTILHAIPRTQVIVVAHSPLCLDRGKLVSPALHLPSHDGNFYSYGQLLSKEEDQILSYFYVLVRSSLDESETKSRVHVYVLQNGDDAWRTHLTLATDYFFHARLTPASILIGNKIYMASARNKILVLDLTASTSSTMQLPQGLDFGVTGTTMLSRADDPFDLCLIHAKELQLHVWLNKRGNWLLVENICLRGMCAQFLQDNPTALLRINHVGGYTTGFLLLKMGRWPLCLDVKCRTLWKLSKEDRYFGRIYPFTMIWPPVFPALKDGHASNAT